MSLNDIQLPASAIAELYRSSLIETNETPVKIETSETPVKVKPVISTKVDVGKYLGENKKNILVVVDYSDAVYLPDEELSFLTNMLVACKLSLADVAIINRNNYKEANYKELVTRFKSRIVFLFGVDPVSFGLPLSFPHFQVQPFANATFLFSPALEEYKNDKLLKSKLWVCLQRIFVI
jgi:hypothetical protein